MKIVHLQHSGVMLESATHQFFFDVISDIKAFINPEKRIVISVSHSHGDHFVPKFIQKLGMDVRYIFSEDVPKGDFENVVVIRPGESYEASDFTMKAYASSDLGNSYVLQYDTQTIFFAGDLNWWHWQNADATSNKNEEILFKGIAEGIKERHFDIAFIPVDPRQGEAFHWTGRYFLEAFDIDIFVPIHFGSSYNITEAFQKITSEFNGVCTVHTTNECLIES